MLKKFATWSLMSLVLFAGVATAELNIAVIDTNSALANSEEAKNLLEGIQAELQKDEEELKKLADSIRSLEEKLQKDGEVMSVADQRKIQKDIEDKRIDLQFLGNKLQKAVNDKRQELMQVMAPKLNAVLKDLIDLEGYDVVFERGNMLYANSKHDITRKVTEKLNEKR
ncbi:MAG: OmpH family outer membrane protein [Proteobacteria bacterium]|nr:OmpH family outer membrane protein [Pseudomonadota bacterium]